ncbi:hypothetical protein TNCV_1908111 [Trichonephila clavipes]|nr:hypothetical protein TNCV_1908111 [Trichonephila clavipes]
MCTKRRPNQDSLKRSKQLGMVVKKGRSQFRCHPRHLTGVRNYEVANSPRVALYREVNKTDSLKESSYGSSHRIIELLSWPGNSPDLNPIKNLEAAFKNTYPSEVPME